MTLNFDESIYVYFTDLNRFNIDDEQLNNVLNGEEKKRVDKFKHQSRKKQFSMARWLIKIALRDKFEIDFNHNYQLKEFRYWTVVGTNQQFSVTISHSKNIVAVAVTAANQSIGIDVEKHKARDYFALAKSFTHPNELKTLIQSVNKETVFYKLWTAKEALYKASETTFDEISNIDLSIYIDKQDAQIGGHYFQFWSLQEQQYSLTICSKSCQRAEIQEIKQNTA